MGAVLVKLVPRPRARSAEPAKPDGIGLTADELDAIVNRTDGHEVGTLGLVPNRIEESDEPAGSVHELHADSVQVKLGAGRKRARRWGPL